MISRKEFLFKMTLGAAAMAMTPQLSIASTRKNRLQKIGYISNLLKNEFENGDWKWVLKKSVEMGFTEYEGGVKGTSAKDFLKYCKEIGLKPVAGKISKTVDQDIIKKDIDLLNELEMEYAVNYYPWFTRGPFDIDDCKKTAEWLNMTGELVRKNGLKFCWHNHDKEFWEMEGGLPFHYLMEHTDKSLVDCEMDIYWVKKGGGDPLEILKMYDGRIPILHVKDMAKGDDQSFACPGSGIIDFPSVFSEAHRQNIKHYMVEVDKIEDGFACLKSGGEYLRNVRF